MISAWGIGRRTRSPRLGEREMLSPQSSTWQRRIGFRSFRGKVIPSDEHGY